jgi:uncharacterized protein
MPGLSLKPKWRGALCIVGLIATITVAAAWRLNAGSEQERRKAALITAVKQNDTTVLKTLLAEGADPNARDASPIKVPLWQRLRQLFTGRGRGRHLGPTALLILNGGASLPSGYLEPPENVEAVRALLDGGADVNATTSDGTTALMHASLYRHYATIDLLLARGAEVNRKSLAGNTALNYAVGHQDHYLQDKLRRAGATR